MCTTPHFVSETIQLFNTKLYGTVILRQPDVIYLSRLRESIPLDSFPWEDKVYRKNPPLISDRMDEIIYVISKIEPQ